MTTSNLRSLSKRKERFKKEFALKFKAILFLTSLLCFTVTVSAQEADSFQDLEKYKATWMQDHNVNELTPEQYELMKSEWELSKKYARSYKREENEPANPERQKQYENWRGKNVPSGFPTYEITGDKLADDAIYEAKKQQWIDKYPKLYQQMISGENKEMTEAERKEREQVLNQK